MAANFTTTGSNTYPAGITLQTEHNASTLYVNPAASVSWSSTSVTAAITVKSTSSVIVINAALQLLIFAGGLGAWFRVNESTTSYEQIWTSYWGTYDEETGGSGAFISEHDHNQNVGVTLTYTINMHCQAASGSGLRVNDYFTGGPGYSSITLTEVQA